MSTEEIAVPSPVERELLTFFDSSSPITIFDIGSCDGLDAIWYSRHFPKASIHCFEPIPGNVQKLRENVVKAGITSITVHEVAMSNSNATAMMQVSSGSPDNTNDPIPKSSSLLKPDKHLDLFPWCKFDTEIEVRTETLDHFCKTNSFKTVDFIHLDVQGAELMVLEGAGDFIRSVQGIWVEVENISLYKNQPLRGEIEQFMDKHDFVLVKYRIGGFSGDQFYMQRSFIEAKKGKGTLRLLQFKSSVLRNGFTILLSRLARKFRFLLKG